MKVKRLIYLVLPVAICVGTFLLVSPKKKGFTLHKIRSSFTPSAQWRIEEPSAYEKKEIQMILEQDFNYLGSGAQAYAFLSADGKYVLKFFKIKHLTPKNWLKLLPIPGLGKYRFRKIDRRNLHKQELFMSYKMAYETLREETGLVYIHLNKTKDLHTKVKLFDRMRKCSIANLDGLEFVLQKKAQIVRDTLTSHMQKGDLEGARLAIRALLSQVVNQCKKGFIDRDSGVSNNYGFVGSEVIHFDAGRLVRDETAKDPSHYHREVLRVGKKLENWVKVHRPLLLPALEEEINAMIDLSSEEGQSPSHR